MTTPAVANFITGNDDTQITVPQGSSVDVPLAPLPPVVAANTPAFVQFKLDTISPNNLRFRVFTVRTGNVATQELDVTFDSDVYETIHEIIDPAQPVNTITHIRYTYVSGSGGLRISDTLLFFKTTVNAP